MFTRFPEPGRVKTRLIPALGAAGAAELHRRLVLRTLRTAEAAGRQAGTEVEIRFAGGSEEAFHHWLGDRWVCRAQSEGDLGERMARAFADSFQQGSLATVIIGSDCPGLTAEILIAAFKSLAANPVVFGPARDGGYYLVGLTRPVPSLFRDIAWGAKTVLADSLQNVAQAGLTASLLEPLNDIDRPEDLPHWHRLAGQGGADRISVIIPSLNERGSIAATLESAQRGAPQEIIVVDGGSTDGTSEVVRQAGATLLASKPGRARQLNAGAAAATGNILLFVHADTLLPADWPSIISRTLRPPEVVAGAFSFRIAGRFPGKRFVEWAANWRSRARQMPYGDQGIFLRQAVFEEAGGFASLPIMEDFELARRLRLRGRIITAPEAAVTSGRRWQRLGVVRATLTNQLVIAGYHLGVCPRRLVKFYRGE